MNKFYGQVGYVEYQETALDIWSEVATERTYVGDILKDSKKWEGTTHLNDNVALNNRVSIVADPYAYEHCQYIRYCVWRGAKWEVAHVTVSYPRIILDLGGVYNGATTA